MIDKTPTYVTCHRCIGWTDNFRRDNLCRGCNNSKLVRDPHEILCNMCGESMCPIGTANEQYPHGLNNASVTGGYDSYHLFDMTKYTFSFCEKCLRKMFMECKIKPTIKHINFDGDVTREELWKEDQEAYEYRVWKDDGGFHQAYVNSKCNAIINCPNDAVYTHLLSNNFTEQCACEEHKEYWTYSNTKLVKFIPNILKPFL